MKRLFLLLSLVACAAALTGCAVDEYGNPVVGVVPGAYGVAAPYPAYGDGVGLVDAGVYPEVVYTENDYYYRGGHRYLRADARARAARRGYGRGRLANSRGGAYGRGAAYARNGSYGRGAAYNRGGNPMIARGGAPGRGAVVNRGGARPASRPAPAPSNKKH